MTDRRQPVMGGTGVCDYAQAGAGCLEGPGGWILTPEGAAVHEEQRVGVIADVHLGYEWARGSGGDALPAHSLGETLSKLTTLLARVRIERLIVAGDLVESPSYCRRTLADVRRLSQWLEERGVSLQPLQGNHDPPRRPALPRSASVGDWMIGHGDRPIDGERIIFGHYHPVLRAGGITAPCFLVGETTIALPAFSENAAGLNITQGAGFLSKRGERIRCIASTSTELLDFGDLGSLAQRL